MIPSTQVGGAIMEAFGERNCIGTYSATKVEGMIPFDMVRGVTTRPQPRPGQKHGPCPRPITDCRAGPATPHSLSPFASPTLQTWTRTRTRTHSAIVIVTLRPFAPTQPS